VSSPVSPARLTEFLRARQHDILVRWEAAVRALPTASQLDQLTLLDHIPSLLDRIADLAASNATDADGAGNAHSLHRLDEGFDLTEVIVELGMLRDCVVGLWHEDVVTPLYLAELRSLQRAIDQAVLEAVMRFTQARDRTLAAIDQIVTVALESADLDELLRRLLGVFVKLTPAVDTAAILLREGDVLRVHATCGLGDAIPVGTVFPIGDGFAGAVATSAVPMTVRLAADDPLVESPKLRELGLQTLYGVPLLEAERVIGITYMGSRTAPDFSVQDKRLLVAMAARAGTSIVQHLLAARVEERELQLRVLADNIPQLAWMSDAKGRIFWVNQRWLDYTGVPVEQLDGEGRWQFLPPERVDEVARRIETAMAAGEPWESMDPLRDADGHFRWFLCRGIPIRDDSGPIVRWLCTCTDVTLRRFLDQATALLSSTLDYEQTLERLARLVVPDLADWCAVDLAIEGDIRRVAITHEDPAKLELANEYAARYGHMGMGVDKVVQSGEPTYAPRITDESLAAGVPDPAQRAMLTTLGLRSAIIVPLTARGRVLGAITLLTSESRRIYQPQDLEIALELGRRAGIAVDNARLYAAAQQAVRVREDVLAIVSHDLRNPLGAVDLSASMLMQRTGNDARARKQLEIIRRSTMRMEHLITDLLDMASIQAGRLSLTLEPHDAEQLVIEAIETHAPIAAERQIDLHADAHLDGVTLRCDRERMSQVFGNLISNAIKFCRPGDQITLVATADERHARFEVRDTGPGIAASELPRIFDPYWTAQRHGKKGTGLGLYICKGIVEAHGGTLSAKSELGAGATFIVTLPRA
jgi:PAS domain S-box-containing protein